MPNFILFLWQGLCLSRVHETENAGFSTSQTIDEIDTQESIQTNIAPFNPNQNIFVEVNQVQIDSINLLLLFDHLKFIWE
jgi:hypothetical protein